MMPSKGVSSFFCRVNRGKRCVKVEQWLCNVPCLRLSVSGEIFGIPETTPSLEIFSGSMAMAFRSPVRTLSDKDKLKSIQSKSFDKFSLYRHSHDFPYLPDCRKLIIPETTKYKNKRPHKESLETFV